MGGHAVRAEDTCLPAPAGKTPPGSHWHYRTDPVKQTKCWYLRSDAAQPAAGGGTRVSGWNAADVTITCLPSAALDNDRYADGSASTGQPACAARFSSGSTS